MSADHDERRNTFLSLFLGTAVALFSFTFLLVILGKAFLLFVMVVGGIGMMSWVHYVLWGKLLTERTAGEREEHLLLERMREEESDKKRSYER